MALTKILMLPVLTHSASAWMNWQSLNPLPAVFPDVLVRAVADQTFVLQLDTPSWSAGSGSSSTPSQYLGCNGYGTDNKNLASLWTIINGQLINLSEGGYLSAATDDAQSGSPFSPSPRVQALSSGFALSSGGLLNWVNDGFSQGAAKFCQQESDGLVVTYSGTAPNGCLSSNLRAISPGSTGSSPGGSSGVSTGGSTGGSTGSAGGSTGPSSGDSNGGASGGSSGVSSGISSGGSKGGSSESSSGGSTGSSNGGSAGESKEDPAGDSTVAPTDEASPTSADSASSATSAAAPSSTNAGPKCQVQTGTNPPTFSPNAESPSAEDVENASIAWLNDVCTVDSFLNKPVGGPTSLETTIAFAIDEPVQLATLSSIPNLSKAGQSAAAALEANFPGIPANLDNLKNGKATAQAATAGVNLVRCCVVLRSIGVLIQEASAATGAFSNTTVPQPVYPVPCASLDCSGGASPGTSGTGWFVTA